jgi:putative ABC transport system permease protein
MTAGGLARALSGASTAALTGAGAATVFVGAALLAPGVSRPVVRLLAAPFPAIFGAPGRLAKQNALRSPRRTAATASALMIGLALIGAVSVLNSSARVSIDNAVATGFGADYVVTSRSFVPFGTEVVTALADVPGVSAAVPLYVASARLGGRVQFVTAGDEAGIAHALRLSVIAGAANGHGLLVPEAFATAHHLKTGSIVPVQFENGYTARVPVSGIFATSQIFSDVVLPPGLYRAHVSRPLAGDVFLTLQEGVGTAARKDLNSVLAGYPNLKLLDQTGVKQDVKNQIATLTNLVLALLLLAVIIAAIGIVNTLALSVVERTREIGLLRAVGTSRRQLRRMVRLEAVVISVFGALLGLVLGVAFGAALRRSLESDGFSTLSIPVAQLVAYLAGAALIGVVAAVWPAWRASRLNVLNAIAFE